MNKLCIVDEKIEVNVIDGTLEIQTQEPSDFFSVTKIEIQVLSDTSLYLFYEAKNSSKFDITIKANPNTKLKIYEIRTGVFTKVQYQYELYENAHIEVEKFYDIEKMKELDIVQLNGEKALFRMLLKSIAGKTQKYDMMIYHNAKETTSNIINQGISHFDGKITFNITGVVPNGKTNCICKQQNRILNLNDGKNQINPNLLIDEYNVEAQHGALIGKFEDEELFYLQSRGISKKEAYRLLIDGFLKSFTQDKTMEENIKKTIQKYWG